MFSNITLNHIDHQSCFIYVLTLAQIQRIERFLGGSKVRTFKYQGIPATRARTGLPAMVMPNYIEGVAPEIGAEIVCDWIVEKAGHSSPIARISACFNETGDDAVFGSYGKLSDKGNKKEYVYDVSRRRLVTNATRSAIITYYNGR